VAGSGRVVKGVVRDPAGKPVPGARILFVDGPAPLPDIAALTDADGSFALSAPAPGTYQIEAHTDEFAPARAAVAVPNEGQGTVDIEVR
jgi:protocatechuate 3,4-dioxygenase beta subunit